jgi:hypothetical protein
MRTRGRSSLALHWGLVVTGMLSIGCSSGNGDKSAVASQAASDSAGADSLFAMTGHNQPAAPKVPFGGQPCQSLTPAEQQSIGMPANASAKASGGSSGTAVDNACAYADNSLLVGISYGTQADYDMNSSGNRSADRQAPSDLPGAFYDGQGGLWFATHGYYVHLDGLGSSKFREPAARVIVGKI